MQEFKRVINTRWLMLIIIMLLINAAYIISNEKDNASVYNEYNNMLQSAAGIERADASNSQIVTEVCDMYFNNNGLNIDNTVEPSQKVIDARNAKQILLDKASYVDSYSENIVEKINESENILRAGLYNKQSFEYKNLLKTRRDLKLIQNLDVKLGNGIWLEKLYCNKYINIYIMIAAFSIIYSFLEERKAGLYYIVHSSKGGRQKLFFCRSLLLIGVTVIVSIVFYIETSLILFNIYGGINQINQYAESDVFFFLMSGSRTRFELALIMCFISAICSCVMALIMWFVVTKFSNINVGILLYVVICGIEILIHTIIPSKSFLRGIHFINLYYMIFPNQALAYYNWGYSIGITSLIESTVVTVIVLGITFMAGNYYNNSNAYYSGKENALEKIITYIMQCMNSLLERFPNIIKEMHKILISQKIIIILAILLYVAANVKAGSAIIYTPEMSYMSKYYDEAYGLRYGDELERIYNKYEMEFVALDSELDENDYFAEQIKNNRKSVLNSIRENIDYVKDMNDSGVDVVVLKPYEYIGALGDNQSDSQEILALLNVIVVISLSFGFMSYEIKNNMKNLACTYSNRRQWICNKIIAIWIIIALFELVSYGLYYHNLFNVYDVGDLFKPLKSIPQFQNYVFNISIGSFMAIDLVFKFVMLVGISAIVCFMSIYIKYIYCLIVSLIMVLPQVLQIIGIYALEKISIGRYVAYVPCLLAGKYSMIICNLIIAIIIIIGGTLYIYMVKKVNLGR